MIFVDEMARVYNSWDDYVNGNTVSRQILIAPNRGVYSKRNTTSDWLEVFPSPDCGIGSTVIRSADVGTTIASLGSSGILIASIASAPIAAPLLAGAVVVGIGCGAYSMIRSSYSLFDRNRHEQSISLADSEARGSWFGVVGGAAGMAAGGITRGVSYLAQNGTNITTAVRTTVNLVNATAITANGVGVVNGFFGIFVVSIDLL